MRSLKNILEEVFIHPHKCYITRGGKVIRKMTPEALVEYGWMLERDIYIPKAVVDYLKETGVIHEVRKVGVWSGIAKLRRLTDGARVTVECYRMQFDVKYRAFRRFLDLGLHSYAGTATCFYVKPEDYEKVTDFLRVSGVEFEYDAPPWIERELKVFLTSARMVTDVKPSSRRAGRELSRLFGFE